MEMFLILKIIEYHFDILKGTVPCLLLYLALRLWEEGMRRRREGKVRVQEEGTGFSVP